MQLIQILRQLQCVLTARSELIEARFRVRCAPSRKGPFRKFYTVGVLELLCVSHLLVAMVFGQVLCKRSMVLDWLHGSTEHSISSVSTCSLLLLQLTLQAIIFLDNHIYSINQIIINQFDN